MQMPKVIVEGNIGAGKSTLAKQLANDLHAVPVLEGVLQDGDVEGCPWLGDYYKKHVTQCPKNQEPCSVDFGSPGVAFKTQVWFVWNRFEKYRSMCRLGGRYVGDRSLWGDLAFARTQLELNKMDKLEFETYYGLWKTMTGLMMPPDIVVYLDAEPQYVYEQIAKRGRGIEQTIELSYLQSLHDSYMNMLEKHLSKLSKIIWVDRRNIEGEGGSVKTDSREYKNLLTICNMVFGEAESKEFFKSSGSYNSDFASIKQ